VKLAVATGLEASFSAKVYAGQPRTIGHPITVQTSALRITLDGSVGTPARYLLVGKNLEPVAPASLYLEQLKERLGVQALRNISY